MKRAVCALVLLFAMSFGVQVDQVLAASLQERVTGYILLQVESHGEAWYVDPVTLKRYYLKDGPTAYEMMRTFGLGISEVDYQKLISGDRSLLQRLRGRIVLRVQQHGEAYYLHPGGEILYLADGPVAYQIMRQQSLGITNHDLAFIPEAELSLKPYSSISPSQPTDESEDIQDSQYQAGETLGTFSAATLNAAWLDMLNAERQARGLSVLQASQALVDATTSWAAYLGDQRVFTHTRPDGSGLLTWGQIYVPQASAYGENLASVATVDSVTGFQTMLDQSMAMFMAEEPDDGSHFRNLINAEWQSAGVGVYFAPLSGGMYQAYLVFQFADSL